jgi:hypothetical protein
MRTIPRKWVGPLCAAALAALATTPAWANNLNAAVATDDCCTYTVTYSTTDHSLATGDLEHYDCSFTLTPASGPAMTITCPTVTAVADSNGNATATTGPVTWPGGCMIQGFTLGNGTATMTTPAGEHSSVVMSFNPSSQTCGTPPPPTISASATETCCGYSITFNGGSLTPGDDESLGCSFTMTPASGPAQTITCPPMTGVADASGNLNASFGPIAWPGGCMTDSFSVGSGTATLTTPGGVNATGTISFSPSLVDTCGPPTGKTLSIGPSSMEGNLFIHAGDWVSGGYSFSFVSGSHIATTYTVTATVAVPVTCPQGGGSGGTIVVDLGTKSFAVPAGNTKWLPTGDQNNILSWDGAVLAPDLCGGNVMNNSKGAIFTAIVSQDPPSGSLVNWRFHYRDPASKQKPNTNCTDASDPNRNRADVCGASWSQTVRDP